MGNNKIDSSYDMDTVQKVDSANRPGEYQFTFEYDGDNLLHHGPIKDFLFLLRFYWEHVSNPNLTDSERSWYESVIAGLKRTVEFQDSQIQDMKSGLEEQANAISSFELAAEEMATMITVLEAENLQLKKHIAETEANK